MADSYNQIYTFILYAVGIGILLGLIYDVFRIVRMAFTVPGIVSDLYRGREYKNRFLVNIIGFVCDILFFVIAAVISAIFIFHVNNGRIRGIALFGSLVGFTAYYNTVGRLVTLISGAIIRGVCHTVRFIAVRIILPVLRLIKRGVQGLLSFERLLYTKRRTRRIISRLKKKGC